MRIFRAVFGALVMISVAMLPVPGALAHAHSPSQPSWQAVDCCAAMPCEKQVRDCGSPAGCTLKCFNSSGAVPPEIVLGPSLVADKIQLGEHQSVRAPANSPPLPPPRV